MLCCGSCDSKNKHDEANFNEAMCGEVTPDVDAAAPRDRKLHVPSLPSQTLPAADSAGKGASEPTTSSPPAPAVVAEPVVAAAAPELKEKKSEGYQKAPEPAKPAAVPKKMLPKLEGKITPDQLRQCWDVNTNWMIIGAMTSSYEPFAPRETETSGSFDVNTAGIAWFCRKGRKGEFDTAPNQDNFCLAELKNGWRMACCMDGHGSFGQLVATMAVQMLPYLIAQTSWKEDDLPDILVEAFESVHSHITAVAEADGWSVDTSGCTAVLVLWKDKKVYVSHVGDSRCVIGSESKLLDETKDHKPSVESEKQRIQSLGGEVQTEAYSDGWTEHRIFVKDTEKPGLSMCRSIGDTMVKGIGVISTPDVKFIDISADRNPFMILASDGVWEFMTSDTVVKAATSTLQGHGRSAHGLELTVRDLYEASAQCWKNAETDYCDDITAILVDLS